MGKNLLKDDWTLYQGAGGAEIRQVSSESKFGLTSMALIPLEYYLRPEGNFINVSILPSKSNGYSPDLDLIVAPNTVYSLSVWLMTAQPSVRIMMLGWDAGGGRHTVGGPGPGAAYGVASTGEWQKFVGEFTTLSNTVYASPTFDLNGYNFELGSPLYVDHPVMVEGLIDDLPSDPFFTRNVTIVTAMAVPILIPVVNKRKRT